VALDSWSSVYMIRNRAIHLVESITFWHHTAARRSHPRQTLVALLILPATALAAGTAAAYPATVDNTHPSSPIAVAARELTLYETGNLHLVSHHHEQIVETGRGTGTLSGSITVSMTLAFSHASVTFTAYPSNGGTVVGYAEGTLYAGGRTAHFSGNATIRGGSGRYAHASGRNIRLEGTLQRHTFALYVKVQGKMRY
jgi:hypothetical protein